VAGLLDSAVVPLIGRLRVGEFPAAHLRRTA
jgi:hypothetical protein